MFWSKDHQSCFLFRWLTLLRKECMSPNSAEREKNLSVIKLRSSEAHLHTGLAVALFISLQERLSSPLEVLASHKDVQEQDADDFIRRWIAAEKLKQYLGSGRSILFVILNADLLKPSIQNMLLSKIQGARRGSVRR